MKTLDVTLGEYLATVLNGTLISERIPDVHSLKRPSEYFEMIPGSYRYAQHARIRIPHKKDLKDIQQASRCYFEEIGWKSMLEIGPVAVQSSCPQNQVKGRCLLPKVASMTFMAVYELKGDRENDRCNKVYESDFLFVSLDTCSRARAY